MQTYSKMTWVLTAISLFGNYLNSRRSRVGFVVWICVNIGWLAFDLKAGNEARAMLDIVQTGFCVYGLIEWKRKENPDGKSDQARRGRD